MITIQLVVKGKVILFDSTDLPLIQANRWRVNSKTGYVSRAPYNRETKKLESCVYLHRELLGAVADGLYVDHKNRNKLDNRRCNLRPATPSESSMNRECGRGRYNYTGVTVTSTVKNGKKYEYIKAIIAVNGKTIYLGVFSTPELAAMAYNEAAVKYFGEFAYQNKV